MEESNARLLQAMRQYTVIAIQSYLLETGAVTEIKDHLAEDFKVRFIMPIQDISRDFMQAEIICLFSW